MRCVATTLRDLRGVEEELKVTTDNTDLLSAWITFRGRAREIILTSAQCLWEKAEIYSCKDHPVASAYWHPQEPQEPDAITQVAGIDLMIAASILMEI